MLEVVLNLKPKDYLIRGLGWKLLEANIVLAASPKFDLKPRSGKTPLYVFNPVTLVKELWREL